jgi:hypothetical protein
MTEQQQIASCAARFRQNTPDHEATVLHDDGLYRHIRVAKPDSSTYWFELVTVPGTLTFRSSEATFTFARADDMFGFFRSDGGKVNPPYWAEKITDDRDRVKVYSPGVFRTVVLEQFHDRLVDGEIPLEYAGAALHALVRDVLDEDVTHDESLARQALESYTFKVAETADAAKLERFHDTWEWDFWAWDFWYLWACHAIVRGIALYDTAKACPECKGERGTHNTTVIASTDGGAVRKCSRAVEEAAALAAETTEADPRVQAARRALASARPYVPTPAATPDADLAERKMRFAEPNG